MVTSLLTYLLTLVSHLPIPSLLNHCPAFDSIYLDSIILTLFLLAHKVCATMSDFFWDQVADELYQIYISIFQMVCNTLILPISILLLFFHL